MQPALRPGDRLLVSPWLPARINDVVVLRDPEQQSIYLVKRLAERMPSGLIVQADNPNVSRDSRHFGPVPRRLLIGRVFFRYLPAERRGWLASRR